MSGRAVEDEGFGVADVLRLAGGILRRHAPILVVLALTLGVVPTVGAEQAVARLLPDDAAGDAQGVVLLTRGLIAMAVLASSYLSETALDVAVVALALGRGHAGRRVPRLVVRLLPVNLLCLVVLSVLVGAAPTVVRIAGQPVLQSWSVMLPVFVAERVRFRDLPRRSLALLRRRPAVVIALLACKLALDGAMGADAFGIEADYPVASAAGWARAIAWSGSVVALQMAADIVFTALYLALRGSEGASLDRDLADAFS